MKSSERIPTVLSKLAPKAEPIPIEYITSIFNDLCFSERNAAPKIGALVQPDHLFTLDEIYTRQTENLTRKAYAVDYSRFGFADYQAALEV